MRRSFREHHQDDPQQIERYIIEEAPKKTLQEAFYKISGENMELDAHKLKDILNTAFMKEFRFDGFNIETCRSLVAMMNPERSDKLGMPEFKKLWNELRLWKTIFKQHDKGQSGTFSRYELRDAFNSVGFRVNNATFNALARRYSKKDGKIYFDDYILCMVKMKNMFDIFNETKKGKNVELTLDQFIQTAMCSH